MGARAVRAPVAQRVRPPRWGSTTTLFQFREPAFWVYVLLLAVTGVRFVQEQAQLRGLSPSGWVLSWVLLALYLLPMFAVIYLLDIYEREPLSLVVGALLWGAVCATTLAGLGNDGWIGVVARLGGPDFAATWSAALSAPLVEESVKAAGVVLIYLIATAEIDDELDGFVYGAMVGLGFAVVENVLYFVGSFGGTPGGVLSGFFVRVLASGLYGHVLYTGLAGMGIAYLLTRRGEVSAARRALVATALCLLAVLAHFLWDSPLLDLFPHGNVSLARLLVQVPLAAAVKGVPFLAVLVVMILLAQRRERRWLEAALEGELGGPGLAAGELEILADPRRRRRVRRVVRKRDGRRAAALVKQLQREQVTLAMLRTRVDADDHPDLVRQRRRIAAICEALAAEMAPAPQRR
ncbi:MAG TPA: PrsW family intramembrane metalloprotease [Actinomycetota bacterium]|nr:PrsW family intramembrane metalloprotease [Actinomycetota bacterium]